MKLALSDGNRPVGLRFAARGETLKLGCIEKGDPSRLVREAPVEKGQKSTCRVVDAGVLMIDVRGAIKAGKEDLRHCLRRRQI